MIPILEVLEDRCTPSAAMPINLSGLFTIYLPTNIALAVEANLSAPAVPMASLNTEAILAWAESLQPSQPFVWPTFTAPTPVVVPAPVASVVAALAPISPALPDRFALESTPAQPALMMPPATISSAAQPTA